MQRVLAFCAAPAVAFFAAFWLLPVAQLLALPSKKGWDTYFAVMTNSRYLQSLVNTVSLSLVVTLLTLTLGAMVGIVLARQTFKGRHCCCHCSRCRCLFPG
jgi:putative spermidine/putrescine transport system permease protein